VLAEIGSGRYIGVRREMTMRCVSVPSSLVAALALSACQTVVVNSHRAPSAGKQSFGRSLAIVNYSGYEDSEQIRRAGERELVNDLPVLNLVPSYRHFSLKELADIGEVKRRASAEGFDGLVVLWLKDVRAEKGPDIEGLEGASYLNVRVSAAVVSLAKDLEVWNGVIERRDDEGKRKDVQAIARAVARQIRSDGLVD